MEKSMLPGKRKSHIVTLSILALLLLACVIPSLNQQILLRTPLPNQGESIPTSANRITAIADLPDLPTPVVLAREPYSIRQGITYATNEAYPEQGCFWLGVAGQVFDAAGNPLEKIVIVIEGTLKDAPVEVLGLTGTTDYYGQHSYEVLITYLPVNSAQTLSIVLYDLNAVQLTNVHHFNTYADCTRNLIRIDFQQNP